MAYTPDPTDSSQPVSGVKASTAAEEFRALKSYIATLAGLTGSPSFPALTISQLNGGQLAGLRNKILNGRFDVWQRGTPVAIGAGLSGYTADQWRVVQNAGISCSASRISTAFGSTDVIGRWYAQFAFSGTGVSGSSVSYRIPCLLETSARTLTLSYYAADSVATSVSLVARQNFGTGGSPSASVDTVLIPGTVASSFGSKLSATFTLPSIAGKTLGNNGDEHLEIFFIPAVADAHTFNLANVQLEYGSTATSYEELPLELIQQNCERVFKAVKGGLSGMVKSAASVQFPLTFSPEMRTAPTLTAGTTLTTINTSAADGINPASVSLALSNSGTHGATILSSNFAGLTAGQACTLQAASSSTPPYFFLSAEL